MWLADGSRAVREALTAVAAVALAFAACGGSTSGGSQPSEAPVSASPVPSATSAPPSVDVSAPPLSFEADSATRSVSFHLVAAHS